ncbi:MAG: orotate phosphoribosyltransferase [Candidatus Omnitrophica bacterium]|nr:orotate phosphoribosyltransferase [Candidatus Omnitrophota bacterium]
MDDRSVLMMLESSGALLKGHFELSSGLHSEQYFQCALLLQSPKLAACAGSFLADRIKSTEPSCVVGLALGAIPLAHEVARALGIRMVFVERKGDRMQLRRGFKIESKERVVVVEDVVTTGGSVQETMHLLRVLGAEIVGVACLVDRSTIPPEFASPFFSLIRIPTQTFDPKDCPLCKAKVPINKPGSKPIVKG